MKVRVIYLLLLIFSLYSQAFTEDQSKNNKTIGYNDYIKVITNALPEFKSNDLNVLSAENKVKSAKSNSDTFFNAGMSAHSNKDYSFAPDKGDVKGYNYSAGLSKTITSTGTNISTTYNYSKNSYSNYNTVSDYSAYEPSVSVKLTQPLLYNFFGKVDSYSENNAKMQLEIARIQLREKNKSILNAYKKLYFQWIMYNENIKHLDKAIKNSGILKGQIRRKVDAGLADNDDYQSSVASGLGYENQRIEYLTSLKNIGKQLSVYVDINDGTPDVAAFDEYTRKVLDSELIEMQFKYTTSAKIMDLAMKNYTYSKGVYENRLLPEFNVFTEVAKKNMSNSQTNGVKDTDYNVGFEFKYYLENNSAESSLKDVEIQIRSLEYEYKAAENSYIKSILSYIGSMKGIIDQLSNKEKTLKALESQLVTEKKKYRQARLNLSYVITTENNITSEKNNILVLRYQLIGFYIDYLDLIS